MEQQARAVRDNIEYAAVALNLSTKQIAEIVNVIAGVDTNMSNFLKTLNTSQLHAIWSRLSEDPAWGKKTRSQPA